MRRQPLSAELLAERKSSFLLFTENPNRYVPSSRWLHLLENTIQDIQAFEARQELSDQKEALEDLVRSLNEWKEHTLKGESPLWCTEYEPALSMWIERASDRLREAEERLAVEQKIMLNPYRAGNPLSPERNEHIYVERKDAERELTEKLLRSKGLPVVFLQGQRRVGKTSLLRFLSRLMGSRTKTVLIDLQGIIADKAQPHQHFIKMLASIRAEAARALQLPEPTEALPESWTKAWESVKSYLESGAAQTGYRLLIILDEYECLHHALSRDADAGAAVLDSMRSLLQKQSEVVFLLAGSAFFTELHRPDWASRMTGAEKLSLDYFNEEQTRKLVTEPVQGKISYENGIPEEIFRLTQGHPEMIQRICKGLVALANLNARAQLTRKDLEKVLKDDIYQPVNGITEIFWGEFCVPNAEQRGTAEGENTPEKQTVRQIIKGEPITDKVALQRLLNHGFVVQAPDGKYRIRVPVFEEWVRRFDPSFR
ncbi:AAA-like domain-containing protein [Rhodoflexus caldus]|uniref:AAA-like domain-containing protein n=1 Tax=Rhodoflexus caldus TaxID=2891236 RepID=UPI00202A5A7F|nr:AAA-like domain-containing protein [Rhodoflexus caldus]